MCSRFPWPEDWLEVWLEEQNVSTGDPRGVSHEAIDEANAVVQLNKNASNVNVLSVLIMQTGTSIGMFALGAQGQNCSTIARN